jgi:hypothetical protein
MIAAVVTAFERPELLRRLLASLRASGDVGRTIVVDNSPRPLACAEWGDGVEVIRPERNLGTGGGVACGLRAAFADPAVTHALICDDDAVVEPGAPAALRAALEPRGGFAAVPMVLRANGVIGWFPGLLDPKKWAVIKRQPLQPAEYLQRCGPEPVRFSWAPWPVLLVTRAAVEAVGVPREDLWYHGVDLEYTLRLTARGAGYFVPSVRSSHLPPEQRLSRAAEHDRECLGLQNQFFMCVHLPHARRAGRHLPGNTWRTVRRAPHRLAAMVDCIRAAWWGGVRGRPATAAGFDLFLRRWSESRHGSRSA